MSSSTCSAKWMSMVSNECAVICCNVLIILGDNAIPLYKWLKNQKGGILGIDAIKWNFTKFLVDKNGVPIKRYAPNVEPKDIEADIKAQL